MPIPKSEKTWTIQGVPISYGSTSAGLGDAPSGYGADYDQMFAANPYRNLTYKKSFWQSIGEALGLRTGYDKWREAAMTNAAEYDADVFALMEQNVFNSPEAMASRERAAGINPDLLGIGDVAQSADMRNDANGMPETESDFSKLTDVASSVSGIVSTVYGAIQSTFAIMKDSKALKNLQLQNDNLSIKNGNDLISGGNSLQSLISDVVWKTTSPDSLPDPKVLSGSLERALGAIFTDKGMYDRASVVAQEFAAGLPQDLEAWKAWHARAGEKVGYASYAGSSDYSEDMTDAMLEFYGFQRDLYNAVKLASMNESISNSNEQIQFNDAHDATLEGLADNAGYSADIAVAQQKEQEARIAHAINSTFDKWCSSLERKANSGERGSMWASIALALIGMVRLTALSGISFSNRSQRSMSVNRYTGEISNERESSSFNLGF